MFSNLAIRAYTRLRDRKSLSEKTRLLLFLSIIKRKAIYPAYWTLRDVAEIPAYIGPHLRNIILNSDNAHVAAWAYKEIPGWTKEELVILWEKIKPSWQENLQKPA